MFIYLEMFVVFFLITRMDGGAGPRPEPQPEISCVSMNSDHSRDRLTDFKDQQLSKIKR